MELNKQITDIAGQERLLLLLKQQGAVSPDLFLSRSDQLAEQRRTAKLKKERLLRSEEDHTIQRTQDLLDHLRSGPDTLESFDEALFSELAEKIIVTDNETLRFRLINGLELTESIERTKRYWEIESYPSAIRDASETSFLTRQRRKQCGKSTKTTSPEPLFGR